MEKIQVKKIGAYSNALKNIIIKNASKNMNSINLNEIEIYVMC